MKAIEFLSVVVFGLFIYLWVVMESVVSCSVDHGVLTMSSEELYLYLTRELKLPPNDIDELKSK